METIARFLVALVGMCGLVLCAVITPTGAVARLSRQTPVSATISLAVAGRPHQATERSWQAAQTSDQVTMWSRRATAYRGVRHRAGGRRRDTGLFR